MKKLWIDFYLSNSFYSVSGLKRGNLTYLKKMFYFFKLILFLFRMDLFSFYLFIFILSYFHLKKTLLLSNNLFKLFIISLFMFYFLTWFNFGIIYYIFMFYF